MSWIPPRTTNPWWVPEATVESPATRPLSLINVAALSLPPRVPGWLMAPPESTKARRVPPAEKYPTTSPRELNPWATGARESPGIR